ncbi:hypothetical protein ACVIRO_002384 [Rhizobium ruizarguesonis]
MMKMLKSKIMQDLLDGGAIRPECVDEFKARIEAEKKAEKEARS